MIAAILLLVADDLPELAALITTVFGTVLLHLVGR